VAVFSLYTGQCTFFRKVAQSIVMSLSLCEFEVKREAEKDKEKDKDKDKVLDCACKSNAAVLSECLAASASRTASSDRFRAWRAVPPLHRPLPTFCPAAVRLSAPNLHTSLHGCIDHSSAR
jgi:cytidylate kinase